jgi:flavin-dependent dehydrogenase
VTGPPMLDLLIVGGGPIGLATAVIGAERGLRVAVAEPRSGPVDKACGEGLMPPAVARLRALGVQPEGHALAGIRYLDSSHSADARFRHGGTGLGVRRTILHAALAERAAQAGVEVIPRRVTEFVQKEDCVEALGIRAHYLVAADGLHSPIRRACGLDPPTRPAGRPRFGIRRHYRVAPPSGFVEVYWERDSEAYLTPLADDLLGVAILGPVKGGFAERLAAFPAVADQLAGAEQIGSDRGAGPLRQNVPRRIHGRVLLVGDASGYVDALTGEGISVGLAQADALVDCVAAGRPEDYERRWRQVSRTSRLLTAGLLWARNRPALGPRIVPTAAALPAVFGFAVGRIAG